MNHFPAHWTLLQCVRWILYGPILVGLLGGSGLVNAQESNHDYLIFLDASAHHHSGTPIGDDLKRNEGEAKGTFLYSWQNDRYRFFTEMHVADEGEAELARLQWGWRLAPQTTAWVGRFHNPQGYWNTQYHHGAYLQTTINRPGIEQFDDMGGVIPSHFVGVQLDSTQPVGNEGSLRSELGLGVGGELDEMGLESPLLVGPQRSSKMTASLRLSYMPWEAELDSFGVFLGQNRIPAKELDFREVHQIVAGISANTYLKDLRLTGSIFFVHDELEGGTADGGNGGFANAYLQAEYQLNPAWTPYARTEGSRGDADDPYLMQFHDFVRARGLLGLRRDFGRKQALKVEYTRSRIEAGRYNELAIQWSMVFP